MRLVIFLSLAILAPPVSVFPRHSAPSAEGPMPTSRVLPAYPVIAVSRKVSGAVLIDVMVNPDGKVTDAHVISGPELLRPAAKKAALLWRFEPLKNVGEARSVRLTFIFHEPTYEPPTKAPDFVCPYQIEVQYTAVADSFNN